VAIGCTTCRSGFSLNTAGLCIASSGTCNLPDCLNCGTSQTTCSQCSEGFYLTVSNDTDLQCTACPPCSNGMAAMRPCSGRSRMIDQICEFDPNAPISHCKCFACHPCPECQKGYELSDDGNSCTPINCLLYGCGAANIGVVCQEVNSTFYSCTCPDDTLSPVIVMVPGTFEGCSGDFSDEEVVQNINALSIEAFLLNAISSLSDVTMGDTNGNTFSLSLNSTDAITSLEQELKDDIAAFLGGTYTPDDIQIAFQSKRDVGQIDVTVDSSDNGNTSAASFVGQQVWLFAILLLLQYFF